MKKNLLLTLIILSTFTSLASARFFLGIDGGYSMDKVDVEVAEKHYYTTSGTTITPGYYTKDAYKGNGYLFNINLGTEHHFDKNNYVGFRWLFGLGYGRTTLIYQENKLIKLPSNIIEAKLGADLLLDVIKFGNNSLGVFGGIEGGLETVISDKFFNKEPIFISSNPYLAARAGLSLFLAEHHRIEFITKIPVSAVQSRVYTADGSCYKPIQFMLGYKFIF